MPLYECTFIVRQDVASSDAEKLVEKYEALLKEQGGELVKSEYWGLRTLAYRVKKNRKGHYVHLGLKAEPAALDEVVRQMKLDEDIIRQLVVRVEAISEDPSPQLQSGRGSSRQAA